MTVNSTPRFRIEDIAYLSQDVFSLNAVAAPLPSERDQNFALRTAPGQKFVLKIAKSDETRAVLELQNAALKIATLGAPHLALPRLIPTSSGDDMATIDGAEGHSYFVRLFTWIEGEIWARAAPHDDVQFASLGAALADLDRALQGFAHPAMHRQLHWDVKRADLALEHLPLLPIEQQALVRQFMVAWASVDWQTLRHGLIHGDPNDYNVMVRGGRVIGLLDFGDMTYSAMVCDLAIALAYALLDLPDPMAAAGTIIRAYQARLPLTRSELDALYPLMTARLCMSLCYAAYNAQVKRGDAYQLVTAEPAWALLQKLATLPQDKARSAFRMACEPL